MHSLRKEKKKRFFLKRAKSRNEFQVLVNYLYSQVHTTLLGRQLTHNISSPHETKNRCIVEITVIFAVANELWTKRVVLCITIIRYCGGHIAVCLPLCFCKYSFQFWVHFAYAGYSKIIYNQKRGVNLLPPLKNCDMKTNATKK